jgi:hypothetical protein
MHVSQDGRKACEPGGLEPMRLRWLGKLVYWIGKKVCSADWEVFLFVRCLRCLLSKWV